MVMSTRKRLMMVPAIYFFCIVFATVASFQNDNKTLRMMITHLRNVMFALFALGIIFLVWIFKFEKTHDQIEHDQNKFIATWAMIIYTILLFVIAMASFQNDDEDLRMTIKILLFIHLGFCIIGSIMGFAVSQQVSREDVHTYEQPVSED